ncbi:MAG: hypothetical protein Q9157_004002 [Trypethelium eluteriae]
MAFRAKGGSLIISLAQNAFQRGNTSAAGKYISLMLAKLHHVHESTLMAFVVRKLNLLRGRILFHEQEYAKAEESFQLVFRAYEPTNPNQMDVLSYLVDLYCEQGRLEEAIRVYDRARHCPEESRNLSFRNFRRLQIAQADACIRLGDLDHAEQSLVKLARFFEDNPDVTDIRLNYARVLILLARKAHYAATLDGKWGQAQACWLKAQSIWMKGNQDRSGLDFAVISLSICDTAWEMGQDVTRDLEEAVYILKHLDEGGRCWIRGDGTDWFDWVTFRLQAKGWQGMSK